jgi:predicted N-acyltransferase
LRTPLLEWEWLNALEESGSMSPDTGWIPSHMAVWDGERLVAAAPLYVRTHSMGDFVFDFAWADVAQQIGAPYYPKLVGMSPATPATAYRFLISPEVPEGPVTHAMIEQMHEFAERNDIAGIAFNFADGDWVPTVEAEGFTTWLHQGYNWHNPGYKCFEDYLGDFNKNQRKNIRKERRALDEHDIELEVVRGNDAPDRYFSLMYDFYELHNEQFGPWAAKFLNRDFFEGLADDFAHRVVFVAARERGRADPLAMSFLLAKGDVLVGRYWGSTRFVDKLHFNACYYEPIRWAIEHGVRDFDPGMGSPHKVKRGFIAVPTYSLHYFGDERMRLIMEGNIDRINDYERRNIEELNARLPFANRENVAINSERVRQEGAP